MRKEGRAKVTGASRYIDDIVLPGMLHGATIRSPIARGILRGVHFDPSLDWSAFTIVTAADIPGKNHVALLDTDQPFLAARRVNHPEEPIALIAHEDKFLVEKARRLVRVDIEPQAPVLTLEDSLSQREIVWGRDNIFKAIAIEKGNVDGLFPPGAVTVEGEYSTGAQEQLYIENNGMLAVAEPGQGVTVWGSMQCPYYVHKALVTLFGLPPEKIRVVQTETGGGFGGKEDYPSIIAGHAALLAWKAGRPVKLVYDRAEDMAATTKRHPSRTRIRTRVAPDGTLLSQDIDFVLDGGAYQTLSPVVLSRGAIHAAGPYRCDNVRVRAKAVATNLPPHGAFRGFGAPQSLFAIEKHMDRIAQRLGLAPEEVRRRNWLRPGDTTATGHRIDEKVDFDALFKRAFQMTGYAKKRTRFAAQNAGRRRKKGIGFACFFHGAGFTGSGESYLASIAAVEALPEGRLRVLASSTEIGQGTNTIFSQVVAEALGIHADDVVIARPDTAEVPNSGPTVASRTVMIVGKLVETAALAVRETLFQTGLLRPGYDPGAFREACRLYVERYGRLVAHSHYKPPAGVEWDDKHYRGAAYATYAWAVYVAEVTVDTVTYETKVDDFVAVQEVGKVLHPLLAAGQIEGGVAQGIGWSLYEKVVWREGRMVNNQMTNYIMPTSTDLPDIRVAFLETNREHGPQGAKGIGELPIDGPGPAILNAVEFATGAPVSRLPLMPEDLRLALGDRPEVTRV